jgi:phosphoglycerate-specific signal transduction histidine kinase
MIDTEQFDGVLREIEVGVDISEGNYDILKRYRDEYQDLLDEVERLRKLDENARRLQEMIDWLHSNFSGYLHQLKEMIE